MSTSCAGLGTGYGFGFLINGATDGTYYFTSQYGTLTGGAPQDLNNFVRIANSNGAIFDWSASLGIDAVIVTADAGGGTLLSQTYLITELKDGLKYQGPTNTGGTPYPVSSIEFCYDYELTVTKTASTAYNRTYNWTLTKDSSPADLTRFANETGEFSYTVTAKKTGSADSNWSISGVVTIENKTPESTTITEINDKITPDNITIPVNCGISLPHPMAPGEKLTCPFNQALSGPLREVNQVTVNTTGGIPGNFTWVLLDWSKPTKEINKSVQVSDTNAAFGAAVNTETDFTKTYTVSQTCPSDPALYTTNPRTVTTTNTAALTSTDGLDITASKTAALHCYLPALSQNNATSFNRLDQWSIAKTSQTSAITLDANASQPVNYNVSVNTLAPADSGFVVSGSITLTNPNPNEALTLSIADQIITSAGTIPANLTDCPGSFTIDAGQSRVCSFSASLNQKVDGKNVVTITLNSGAVVTTEKVFSFSGAAITEKDRCVSVSDDRAGDLGQVCADAAPKAFSYSLTVGPYTACGAYDFTNTAALLTSDTRTSASSVWTVKVSVGNCSGKLNITKTANPSYTRTFTWTIAKTVSPGFQNIYAGQTGAFNYTVAAMKAGQKDSDYIVSGKVTIQNPSTLDATILSITDQILPDGPTLTLDCGLTFPYVLKGGQELSCPYSQTLSGPTNGTNLATVTTSGLVAGGTASSPFTWGEPSKLINAAVQVSDTNAAFGAAVTTDQDFSRTYPAGKQCPADPALYTTNPKTETITNTATLTSADGLNLTADSTAALYCYLPALSQDVTASYSRLYTWSINKSSNTSALTLDLNASQKVSYDVTVKNEALSEAAFVVSGSITLTNPSQAGPMLVDLSDQVITASETATAALTDCTNPVSVPARGKKTCSFQATLKQKEDGKNRVTATIQNGASLSAEKDFTFSGTAVTEKDRCVAVSDDRAGDLGQVCADAAPKTFPYDLTVGPYTACGDYDFSNTATLITGDTKISSSSKWTIKASVQNCGQYQLAIHKTAEPSFTRSYTWSLTKTVDPEALNAFVGQTGIFNYTVTAARTGHTDSNFAVSGKVTIQNPSPVGANMLSITDQILPDGTAIPLDCGAITFPYTLASGQELTCTYSQVLNSPISGKNQVTVTTSGPVAGGMAEAALDWSTPTSETNAAVQVSDTNEAFGPVVTTDQDFSRTYPVSKQCPADPAQYTTNPKTETIANTAALTSTGGLNLTADKTASLNCYLPTLDQSSAASYDLAYQWSIKKTSPTTAVYLLVNESQAVHYDVTVKTGGLAESNFTITGSITLNNPNPHGPLTVTLADRLITTAEAVDATLTDCANPVTIEAGQSRVCRFTATLKQKLDGKNVVTATIQNGASLSAEKDFTFSGAAITEKDRCVSVSDDRAGNLGQVCADAAPKTFRYDLTVGPYATCGAYDFTNSAAFRGNDTPASASSAWKINVTVFCEEEPAGCTSNQNYWRTHANGDKRSYDYTWDKIQPSGPDSPLFKTGSTWIKAFYGHSSDDYYRLARQYMSAVLNRYRGASAPAEVQKAIIHAEMLLSEYDTHTHDLHGTVREDFNNTASLLGAYNEGKIGPGRCRCSGASNKGAAGAAESTCGANDGQNGPKQAEPEPDYIPEPADLKKP